MAADEEIVDSLEGADQPEQPVAEVTPAYDGGEVQVELGQLEDAGGELEAPVADAPVAEALVEDVVADVPADTVPSPASESSPIDPRVQEELTLLRTQAANDRAALAQRDAQAREQQDTAGFQAAMTHRQKELEEQDGLAPERAQAIAQQEIGAAWKAYQIERHAQSRIAEAHARVEVATILSEQHGVPIKELMRHATLPAMLSAAQQATAQNAQAKQIAELTAQVAKLTKDQVPAGQHFDSGPGALLAPGDRQSKLERYIDGELPEKEVAELFR